ncbi:putative basic amino acid antiporter YfcC [Simiduia litorea]|uniref:putative basic amino acid antiporter YfcC n=1 Tax=Simiduia litorea TaxID=1435348 RepID=UPI0036F280FA
MQNSKIQEELTPKTAAPVAISMPDTWLILMVIALVAWGLGWLIPGGYFTEALMIDGRSVIVPESFVQLPEAQGLPLFAEGGAMGLLNTLFEGLVAGDKWGSAIGVFAFILITGGAFGVVFATGAVDAGIGKLVGTETKSTAWLLPTLFLLFSLGGAVFGMGEEAIPFTLMLAPVLVRLGYDGLSAVVVTYLATQVGFATSWMNPFGVAIAQGIAGVPLLSGAQVRLAIWLFFTALGMVWIWRYGRQLKNGVPSLSAQTDTRLVACDNDNTIATFERGHCLILAVLCAGIFWMIWGVTVRQYYLPEIASQFFCMGLAAAVVGVWFKLNAMTANSAIAAFRHGAAQLLPAAMVVAFAKGIVLLLGGDDPNQPSLLNTLLFYAAGALGELPSTLTAWGMYVFQSVFNFFVTSGSGQAALTMPIMSPLSDLLGVTRQTAVLAFQLGDGLTNILIPTSAALMGCLGAAQIEWLVWIKFIWRFFLVIFCVASLCVIGASLTGF